MLKWFEFLSQYKYLFLGVGIAGILSFSSYFIYKAWDRSQNLKAESLLYLAKSKLVQEEKKQEGNVLDPSTPFLSQKKAKDYTKLKIAADEYFKALISVKKPRPVHWLSAIELSYFLTVYHQEKQALELLDLMSRTSKSKKNWIYQTLLLKLGAHFMKNKNYTRAIHLFSLILEEKKAQPFHLEAWFKTALCYESLGETSKAQEIYSMIQQNPAGILYKEKASHYDRFLKIKEKMGLLE